MSNTRKALKLYKDLIKESNKFSSYNYRDYAKRKIKFEFNNSKQLNDPVKLQSLFEKGQQNLDLIKRQVFISQLYPIEKTVLEVKQQKTQ